MAFHLVYTGLRVRDIERSLRFYAEILGMEDVDHLGFEVEDLEDAVKRLEEEGVEVVVRPGTIGGELGWREAFVKDPDGIWIELVQRKKPAYVLRYIGYGGAWG